MIRFIQQNIDYYEYDVDRFIGALRRLNNYLVILQQRFDIYFSTISSVLIQRYKNISFEVLSKRNKGYVLNAKIEGYESLTNYEIDINKVLYLDMSGLRAWFNTKTENTRNEKLDRRLKLFKAKKKWKNEKKNEKKNELERIMRIGIRNIRQLSPEERIKFFELSRKEEAKAEERKRKEAERGVKEFINWQKLEIVKLRAELAVIQHFCETNRVAIMAGNPALLSNLEYLLGTLITAYTVRPENNSLASHPIDVFHNNSEAQEMMIQFFTDIIQYVSIGVEKILDKDTESERIQLYKGFIIVPIFVGSNLHIKIISQKEGGSVAQDTIEPPYKLIVKSRESVIAELELSALNRWLQDINVRLNILNSGDPIKATEIFNEILKLAGLYPEQFFKITFKASWRSSPTKTKLVVVDYKEGKRVRYFKDKGGMGTLHPIGARGTTCIEMIERIELAS